MAQANSYHLNTGFLSLLSTAHLFAVGAHVLFTQRGPLISTPLTITYCPGLIIRSNSAERAGAAWYKRKHVHCDWQHTITLRDSAKTQLWKQTTCLNYLCYLQRVRRNTIISYQARAPQGFVRTPSQGPRTSLCLPAKAGYQPYTPVYGL